MTAGFALVITSAVLSGLLGIGFLLKFLPFSTLIPPLALNVCTCVAGLMCIFVGAHVIVNILSDQPNLVHSAMGRSVLAFMAQALGRTIPTSPAQYDSYHLSAGFYMSVIASFLVSVALGVGIKYGREAPEALGYQPI
mmetsp:Transcript_21262/g.35541  ORF Transcript_21262/g.35541 Transcript_21262/m.35541 type:complete len:138 (-) Transcript_21262:177-590(-)